MTRYSIFLAISIIEAVLGFGVLGYDFVGGLVLLVFSTMTLGVWVHGVWVTSPERWRHKARGSIYTIVDAQGIVQTSRPLVDFDIVVVYQDEKTGRYCVRPPMEFMDGRFEKL